uniref:Si:dkey-10o6.2 n=1 Tax=Sinocyclocheilus rhinocerous TaxID=307959 RepID=A0A673HHT7_9TELE
ENKMYFMGPQMKRYLNWWNVNHGWVSFEWFYILSFHKGVDDFRDVHASFYLRCKELSLRVLRVMALCLNLEAEVFLSAHKHIGSDVNGTTLRTLYYPPVNSTCVKENQLRCGEHSDYGSITLVFQSSEGGLQVLNRAGEFISAPSIPGTVLINIADLMQRWTSDVYVSAVHRVLLPPAGDSSTRQSLAFFVQPDDEAIISCCDGSDKYPPVKSVDYLLSRFKDSYGKK